MTAERAETLARRLVEAAQYVRDELPALDQTERVCDKCGLTAAEDLEEWRWALEIKAAAGKLERIAYSVRGTLKRRADALARRQAS